MEQFVQLPRRDAAHFVRRSEENASGLHADTCLSRSKHREKIETVKS
jgi:hypothetical protein